MNTYNIPAARTRQKAYCLDSKGNVDPRMIAILESNLRKHKKKKH